MGKQRRTAASAAIQRHACNKCVVSASNSTGTSLFTGPAKEDDVLYKLVNTVLPTDTEDTQLDRDSATQPSSASGSKQGDEQAPDEDCDDNCDEDATELEIAISDFLALPGPGGNLVPTDVLLAAGSISTQSHGHMFVFQLSMCFRNFPTFCFAEEYCSTRA